MIISIIPEKIAEGITSEDELLGSSTIESIYQIRKLRAAIQLDGKSFSATINTGGQAYIDTHEIWIDEGEYK